MLYEDENIEDYERFVKDYMSRLNKVSKMLSSESTIKTIVKYMSNICHIKEPDYTIHIGKDGFFEIGFKNNLIDKKHPLYLWLKEVTIHGRTSFPNPGMIASSYHHNWLKNHEEGYLVPEVKRAFYIYFNVVPQNNHSFERYIAECSISDNDNKVNIKKMNISKD